MLTIRSRIKPKKKKKKNYDTIEYNIALISINNLLSPKRKIIIIRIRDNTLGVNQKNFIIQGSFINQRSNKVQ